MPVASGIKLGRLATPHRHRQRDPFPPGQDDRVLQTFRMAPLLVVMTGPAMAIHDLLALVKKGDARAASASIGFGPAFAELHWS